MSEINRQSFNPHSPAVSDVTIKGQTFCNTFFFSNLCHFFISSPAQSCLWRYLLTVALLFALVSVGTVVLWNSPVFVSVFGVSSTVRSLFCSEETGITQKRHPSQDNNGAHTRTPLTPADNAPVWTSTALSTSRTRAGLTADVYRLVLDSETLARCLSVSEKMCPTNHPSHFNFQFQILRRDSADIKGKSAQPFVEEMHLVTC